MNGNKVQEGGKGGWSTDGPICFFLFCGNEFSLGHVIVIIYCPGKTR